MSLFLSPRIIMREQEFFFFASENSSSTVLPRFIFYQNVVDLPDLVEKNPLYYH